MATALTPLANLTLSTPTNSISFTSISGSYRDLILKIVYNNSSNYVRPTMTWNSDTSNFYSYVRAYGTGSSAYSDYGSGYSIDYNGALDGTSGLVSMRMEFLDYAQTDKHKCVLWRVDEPGGGTMMVANRWSNTAAITSIQIVGNFSRTFPTGTTFALYGVSA